jgi:hypothetical protein
MDLHDDRVGRTTMRTSAAVVSRARPAARFEFEALEGLPCGCVAVAYRARPWEMTMISLEAKGPHCVFPGHRSGQVLHFGEPAEVEDSDE